MNTERVMEDGDLRLPPEVAGTLHVKPGDSVGVEVDADGTVRLYPNVLKPEDVYGRLASCTTVKATLDEMDESVAEAFRRDEVQVI